MAVCPPNHPAHTKGGITASAAHPRRPLPAVWLGSGQDVVDRLVVGIDPPLLYKAPLHDCEPRSRRTPPVLERQLSVGRKRAAGGAEDRHQFAAGENFLVRNPIVRTECKITSPSRPHFFSAAD